jgi:hypothetical protein
MRSRAHRKHRGATSPSSSSNSSSSSSRERATGSRRFESERNRRRGSRSPQYSRSRSNSPRLSSTSRREPAQPARSKQRCRDFDEKGYCTRAELCPYDHGDVLIAPANSAPLTTSQVGGSSTQTNINNQMGANSYQISTSGPLYKPLSSVQITMNRPHQDYGSQQELTGNLQSSLLPLPTPPIMPHTGQQTQKQQQRFKKYSPNNFNQRNSLPNTNSMAMNNSPMSSMMPTNGNLLQANTSLNEQFVSSQMRQGLNSNRPRNLVNIVTSIPDEQTISNINNNNVNINQNQMGFNQQRGIKRTCKI